MAHIETLSQPDIESVRTPTILELLSEIEKRERDSKTDDRPRNFQGLDVRGMTVVNPGGNDIGKVRDLYVDPNSRRPRFALLSLGTHPLGINDRQVLVDFDDVTVENGERVHVRIAG